MTISAGGGGGGDARRRQRGAAMLEYVLIAIVVGLGVIFVAYRFGGSLGGRYQSGTTTMNNAKVSGDDARASGESLEFGGGPEGRLVGGTHGGATGGAGEVEPTPLESDTAPKDGKVHVGNFEFDLSTVIWIGLLLTAITAVVVMRVFGAAKAKPKANVNS